MTLGQKLAYHIAPIFLRLVLGLTFLWAGLGKIIEEMEVTEDNAPALVRMHAISQADVQHLLPPGFTIDEQPEATPQEQPVDQTDTNTDAGESESPPPDQGETPEEDSPDSPGEGGGSLPDDGFFTEDGSGDSAHVSNYRTILVQDAPTAAPVRVKRLFAIALMLVDAASEQTTESGQSLPRLLPEQVGQGETPKYLAWAAAITEVFAGGFILIGFLTRLSALAVVGVMGVAIWLTQIGPAAMGYLDHVVLGFLPGPGPGQTIFDPAVYETLWWQFALLGAGLSLFFAGAGALSLDRLLFGSVPDDIDDD